jgi:hypothetical protein
VKRSRKRPEDMQNIAIAKETACTVITAQTMPGSSESAPKKCRALRGADCTMRRADQQS